MRFSEEKEKLNLNNVDACKSQTIEETTKLWCENVKVMTEKIEMVIRENSELEETKRKLQLGSQNVEGLMQITHDCLGYRETRDS